MKGTIFFMLLATVAGAILPVQASLNAKMGKVLGDPVYASLVSFIVGALVLVAYVLATRVDVTQISAAGSAHWSVWMPGLLGAFFVTSTILLVPKIGIALTFGLVVMGQMGLSLILDHYGLMGLPVHPINWQRLLGVLLIIGGVVMIRRF